MAEPIDLSNLAGLDDIHWSKDGQLLVHECRLADALGVPRQRLHALVEKHRAALNRLGCIPPTPAEKDLRLLPHSAALAIAIAAEAHDAVRATSHLFRHDRDRITDPDRYLPELAFAAVEAARQCEATAAARTTYAAARAAYDRIGDGETADAVPDDMHEAYALAQNALDAATDLDRHLQARLDTLWASIEGDPLHDKLFAATLSLLSERAAILWVLLAADGPVSTEALCEEVSALMGRALTPRTLRFLLEDLGAAGLIGFTDDAVEPSDRAFNPPMPASLIEELTDGPPGESRHIDAAESAWQAIRDSGVESLEEGAVKLVLVIFRLCLAGAIAFDDGRVMVLEVTTPSKPRLGATVPYPEVA